MIDQADTKTKALDLDEQPAKPKRGRPATGAAMTPAEKQRAYRERMKNRNVTENAVPAELLEKVRATAAERIEQLEQQLAAAIARAEKAEATIKNNVTVKQKRHRDDTPNVLKQYHAQSWDRGARRWKTIGDDVPENLPFDDWQEAEAFVKDQLKNGSKTRYRIVPANLPVTEYR
jgi:hypothetical protein